MSGWFVVVFGLLMVVWCFDWLLCMGVFVENVMVCCGL